MITKILKYIVAGSLLCGVVSCDDFFDLRPTNKMVIDDYWTSEDDVLAVTASIYDQMNSQGFMERVLLWSEFRSDNCLLGTRDNADISSFANLTLSATNGYTSWSDFYTAINYCNTVEKFAPQVCDASPTFTRAQLDAYIAEVRGLRAWCYFTLIRAFRDIPLVLEPTVDDDTEFYIAQSDPDEIVDFLIDNLKEYEGRAQSSFVNTLYTHGRMTQNAIRTLIADMLLWRGRYDECITYCDMVINDTNNPAMLVTGANFSSQIFNTGNSRESIFELQFGTGFKTNEAVKRFYGSTSVGGGQYINGNDLSLIFGKTDARLYTSMQYRAGSDATRPVAKYTAVVSNALEELNRSYIFTDPSDANWVVYRLADLYLMKAEALAETGGDLQVIHELCSKTFDRANYNAPAGSLAMPTTAEDARQMVFDERQREFAFEGKRYFDILRRIKHHPEEFSSVVSSYLKPRYIKEKVDNQTIDAKLISIDALYMPINSTELRQNPLLQQNPFYKTTSNIEMN